MSVEHPKYWLAYLSDGEGEARDDEITAVAPEILHRSLFGADAQMLLAAADTYHDRHQYERVVFAAAVKEHQFVLLGVGIITVAAGFYFYLRVVAAMYWQEPNDDTPIVMRPLTRIAIGVLTFLIFAVGIFPGPTLSMLHVPAKVAHAAAR